MLSEDVDTLMFGSGMTLCKWSPQGTLKSKVPTHVNVYHARTTKSSSGLDRQGMILVALMSGGDYVPEGIPGCGPKTACEAARAGFGADLCRIRRTDTAGIAQWKSRLEHELRTNECKFFRAKHKALIIPENFPRLDILAYYTHPCVSSEAQIERLKAQIKWDQDFDLPALRTFTGDAFDWICIGGAKKFVRNLAPALLVRQLCQRAQTARDGGEDTHGVALQERRLVEHIISSRTHITTDNTKELRIGFIPLKLVDIDLDKEDPDPDDPLDLDGSEDEDDGVDGVLHGTQLNGTQEPSSPRKKRALSTYDPSKLEKTWVMETYVKVGVPLMAEDYAETFRNAKKYEAAKAYRKQAVQGSKGVKASKGTVDLAMPNGALDVFARVTKPGMLPTAKEANRPTSASQPIETSHQAITTVLERSTHMPKFRAPSVIREDNIVKPAPVIIDIASSPEPIRYSTKKRISRRSKSDGYPTLNQNDCNGLSRSKTPRLDYVHDTDNIVGPDEFLELPPSVTTRRRRSPLSRARSSGIDLASLVRPTTPVDGDNASRHSDNSAPRSMTFWNEHDIVTPTKRAAILSANLPATSQNRTKKRPGLESDVEVIDICSSPATPRSSRQMMSNWLASSPRSEVRDTLEGVQMDIAACRALPFALVVQSQSSVLRPALKNSEIPFMDCTSEGPLTTSIEPGPGQSKAAPQSHMKRAKRSDMIRLRDSLDGAWTMNEPIAAHKGRGGATRGGVGTGVRQWRRSQVETLDLTGL